MAAGKNTNISACILVCAMLSAGCERTEKPLVFEPVDLISFSSEHKGFNLLGKYDVGWSNNGFSEEEFEIVKDLGFNFVRLPLDYRTYTQQGNWDVFLEEEIEEIDQALDYGEKYGVHVCINLHRAPGYCVNPASDLPANQNLDLWTDPVARKAFLEHWEYFALRYRDIPLERLSFNLINEPKDMDKNSYVILMKKAVDVIQSIQPDRIIFIDGLNYSREILEDFSDRQNIIQAIHVYDPMTLTHYKAGWVNGSDTWPLPVWPTTDINIYLFGPWQSQYQSSLVLNGNFPKDLEIIINVRQVSVQATLEIKLDNNSVYTKYFVCGPDPGDDWTQIINTQWGYQNISGKDYGVKLGSPGTKITISNTTGDWIAMSRITLRSLQDTIDLIPSNTGWGIRQSEYIVTPEGKLTDNQGNPSLPMGNLVNKLEDAKSKGIPVMVQEFGVYNKTPHSVSVSYLTDIVRVFRDHDIGYAMWNMIGTMGIINSGRTDCNYETYRGKSLDREMTSVIQGSGN